MHRIELPERDISRQSALRVDSLFTPIGMARPKGNALETPGAHRSSMMASAIESLRAGAEQRELIRGWLTSLIDTRAGEAWEADACALLVAAGSVRSRR